MHLIIYMQFYNLYAVLTTKSRNKLMRFLIINLFLHIFGGTQIKYAEINYMQKFYAVFFQLRIPEMMIK